MWEFAHFPSFWSTLVSVCARRAPFCGWCLQQVGCKASTWSTSSVCQSLAPSLALRLGLSQRWLSICTEMLMAGDKPLLWELDTRSWFLQGEGLGTGTEMPGMGTAPRGGTKWWSMGPPPQLSVARRGYTLLLSRTSGEPQLCATCLWEAPCSFQAVSQGLHITVCQQPALCIPQQPPATCPPARVDYFLFPKKVEEHQRRKKPAEVPCYINSPVGSMTKVLLCCWTIEWIIYSYPPRLAIKQLTTLKITKKKRGGVSFYKNRLFKHGFQKKKKNCFQREENT